VNSPDPPAPPPTPIDDLSFEDAVAQLEAIVEKIERGEIGLERALAEYERGVRLVSRCSTILATVEQRIEELASDTADGSADA